MSKLSLYLLFLTAFASLGCRTAPPPPETVLPTEAPPVESRPPQPEGGSGGGIVEEIRANTEIGTPSSLFRALETIRSRELEATEFGRVMAAVNGALLRNLYPAVQAQIPPQDLPVTHSYSKILREAERGAYTPPHQNSADYLEHVLPFLAYYPATGRIVPADTYLSALPDLERAGKMNPRSALAAFFIGIVYERAGRLDDAYGQFSRVWEQFPDCYPAALGFARAMDARGERQEALRFIQDLVVRFPDNLQVKRQLAISYYHAGDWSRAGAAVAEILQRDSRDGEFVLMRAHILVEEGQLLQAQAPLDIYASINPSNRLYLFLRARVQAEAYNNRDAALNYLRSILRIPVQTDTADDAARKDGELWLTASVYAARLLMESSRPQDQNEGRELLARLLAAPEPSPEVIGLALEDLIRQEAWSDARPYLTRLLEERRSTRDLLSAYTVEKGQGNNAAALAYARELYERDRSNEEGIIAYISALIDTGRRDEAAGMIENRLGGIGGGVLKSRYYYLRSRVRSNEELVMNDLRSSLFEDPRNLAALIAMFEIYHRRRDERRAVYYLKQALALAPENPRLKRYEAEYGAALNGAY